MTLLPTLTRRGHSQALLPPGTFPLPSSQQKNQRAMKTALLLQFFGFFVMELETANNTRCRACDFLLHKLANPTVNPAAPLCFQSTG